MNMQDFSKSRWVMQFVWAAALVMTSSWASAHSSLNQRQKIQSRSLQSLIETLGQKKAQVKSLLAQNLSQKQAPSLNVKESQQKWEKKYDDSQIRKWIEQWRKLGKNPSQDATIPPGYCPTPFEKTVVAVKIKGQSIYLDIDDLEFLKSPGFVLGEAVLDVVLQGRHGQQESIQISLNGLKVRKPGSNVLNDPIRYSNSQDMSRVFFRMHDRVIVGSEQLNRFLLKLKKNKGLLKVNLIGKRYQIISAAISFKGKSYKPCDDDDDNPPPPPPPPPEDLSLYSAKIDSVDPQASVTRENSIVINFSTINKDGTYWCSLDQSAFEKCQSPVSYSGLSNGAHRFEVFATTPRGLDGAKAVYTWSVDAVRPVTTITNLASLPSLTNQTSIRFEFASSKPGSTFRCNLDGVVLNSCPSPMVYTVTREGLHEFSVTAIDSLGNVSGQPATFSWTLDLTPPTANFLLIQPSQEFSSQNSRAISFASSETSDFECSLDQGAYQPCLSPLNLQNLSEGQHVLLVRATDLAGNRGAPISHAWTNDYTAPQVVLGSILPPAGLTNSSSVYAEFSANEPAQFRCQFDQEAESDCASPLSRSSLSDGAHRLSIRALDRAGISSAPVLLAWTIDRTAPLISFGQFLPSAASYINQNNFSVTVNASEEIQLSANLNSQLLGAVISPIELLNLQEGPYSLSVTGVDSAGNASNSIVHNFVVDMTAPQIQIRSEGGSLVNRDFRQFEFSANEQTQFQCSLDDAGFAPCESPIVFSSLADGEHRLVVRAIDLAGNQTDEAYVWSQDTVAPTISQTNVQNGSQITFNLSSNEQNVSFECSLDGVPVSPCSSIVSYSGLAVGQHVFFAQARDAAGNLDTAGLNYTFMIYPPLQTVITSSNPNGQVVNVRTMTIAFTANQPTQGFVCSLDGAAFSPCVSAVTYTGLADGPHSVNIRAIDQFGNIEEVGATRTWTVDLTAPVVSNLRGVATSNSITVTWNTSEPATARVNYGITPVLNLNTAEIATLNQSHSVVLTGLQANTEYSVRVIGRDAAGNTYVSGIIRIRTAAQ